MIKERNGISASHWCDKKIHEEYMTKLEKILYEQYLSLSHAEIILFLAITLSQWSWTNNNQSSNNCRRQHSSIPNFLRLLFQHHVYLKIHMLSHPSILLQLSRLEVISNLANQSFKTVCRWTNLSIVLIKNQRKLMV